MKASAEKSEKGLLASEFMNRANPVLLEDDVKEPKMRYGAIHLAGDYVRFFDSRDSHLQTINSVINHSPTNRAIIRTKANMIAGDGLVAIQGNANALFKSLAKANVSVDDPKILAALNDKLRSVNSDGQSLLDVLSQLATDFVTYGNAYFGMAKAKNDVFCYAIPFQEGKLKKRDKDGDLTVLGVSKDWDITLANKPREVEDIPLYPKWSESEDGVQRTVVHLKEYAPGFDYYGLPEWISALFYVEMEYRVAKFNASKFENGFIPSGVLNLYGAKTTEEAKPMIDAVKKQFTGTGKNGGLMVQVLRDNTYKAEFVKIEDTSEGAFLELANVSAQAIVSAHRWTMALAGFATKGKLGSNEQIRMEFEIVQNTVIRPIQQLILRKCLNVYMSELAMGNSALKGVTLDIANTTPVSFLGDIDINGTLTQDEKRQLAGYEPMPDNEDNEDGNNDSDIDTASRGGERRSA